MLGIDCVGLSSDHCDQMNPGMGGGGGELTSRSEMESCDEMNPNKTRGSDRRPDDQLIGNHIVLYSAR